MERRVHGLQAPVKREQRTALRALRRTQEKQNLKDEKASLFTLTPDAKRNALWLAAIVVVVLVAYSNSVRAPLLFDNGEAILNDSRIRSVTPDHIQRILTHSYWENTPTGLYRPLTTLSYLFNYAVLGNGANPAGYHWVNLTLHAVNMLLVYALGLAIFEAGPAALLLTAIWGLHPVLTESVTNVVGRADILAAFGVLSVLLCYRKALRSSGARRAAWLAAMALASIVGIFSKENGIVAIGVLALYDFTYERAASWRSRIPAYIAVAIPCAVFLAVRARIIANAPYVAVSFVDNPLTGAGFWTARMTAIKVIGGYFQLLLWPARLSFDYSFNAIPLFGWKLSAWEDWKAIFALIACLAAAGAVLVSWRRSKLLFFSILFFFVTLSPVSNLLVTIGSIMGERFLYLPSVGFAACVVWALLAIRRRPAYHQGANIAACVILLAFAARVYNRNGDWLDPRRFWQSAVEAAPGSYKARIGATSNMLLDTQKDWDRSITDVSSALGILDGLPDLQNVANPYVDAGIFYRALGDRLASRKPTDAAAGTSAGYWYRKSLSALLRAEKILVAQDERYRLENARRGHPGLTDMPSALYLELGRTYTRLEDSQHALEAFERGRLLAPDPDVLEELASAYSAAGHPHEAAIALVEALSVDPNRTQLTSKLVEVYGKIDPTGCAISHQGGQPSLDLACPLVHNDLCAASRNVAGSLLRRGQKSEAAAIRQVAVEQLGCDASLLN
jgi:tetratricopeptide (TPR) repeat protein